MDGKNWIINIPNIIGLKELWMVIGYKLYLI
jgi:hypothetical protein